MDDDDSPAAPDIEAPADDSDASSWAGSLLFCDIELEAPDDPPVDPAAAAEAGGVDEEAPEPEPPSPAPAPAPPVRSGSVSERHGGASKPSHTTRKSASSS